MCQTEFEKDLVQNANQNTKGLENFYHRWEEDAELVQRCVAFVGKPNLEAAATWLLKHFLESRRDLDESQQRLILSCLNRVESWQGRLHLLQMLNELLIPEDLQESVAKFCKQSTSDDNKFVRAWGYSGIVSLAKQWDRYVPLAIEAITNGENDEAPSARARIRRIRQTIPEHWRTR